MTTTAPALKPDPKTLKPLQPLHHLSLHTKPYRQGPGNFSLQLELPAEAPIRGLKLRLHQQGVGGISHLRDTETEEDLEPIKSEPRAVGHMEISGNSGHKLGDNC